MPVVSVSSTIRLNSVYKTLWSFDTLAISKIAPCADAETSAIGGCVACSEILELATFSLLK